MYLVSAPMDRCILFLFLSLLCVLATLKHAANDHDNVFISRFPRPLDCSRRESRFLSPPCFFAIIARVILAAGQKDPRRGENWYDRALKGFAEPFEMALLSPFFCHPLNFYRRINSSPIKALICTELFEEILFSNQAAHRWILRTRTNNWR